MNNRLLFIGGRRRGAVVLERLLQSGIPVAGCIIMKDDPHEVPSAGQLETLAAAAAVPFITCKSVTSEHFGRLFSDWKPDIAIAENWRSMVSPSMFTRLGAFAVLHESLLPRYRGFAPLAWQLINGESTFGVTMFHIAEEVDAGDIIDQCELPIGIDDTANDLYDKTIPVYVDMILNAVPLLASGKAPRTTQDHARATFACARTPEDGRIDWTASTKDIYNLIRAVAPPLYPGAWTTHAGLPLTICSARPLSPAPLYVGRVPGRVVRIQSEAVHVLTSDGVLEIGTVRTHDGAVQPASAVIRSIRLQLGASA